MSLLEIRGLNKKFGNKQVLKNIDLSIEKGHIVGLLGPNGSGKTTLIKLLNGLLCPDTGSIMIDGHCPGIETKRIVSYLPDKLSLPDWMNSAGAIDYFKDFYNDFDEISAHEMMYKLNIDMDQSIKSLSKGTKEKLQLILTMSRRAKLYLLDEPIGGVDPATRDYIIHTIISNYSPESSVIISTHLISDVEQILDKVLFLKEGEIVLDGDVESLRDENGKSIDELFREVFRCY